MTKFERLFVWTGGTLFVAALASTAAWYAFALSHVRLFGGWRPLAFDVLLFSVFALHHSALARSPMKARVSRLVPDRLLRSVYVWTASTLLILVCLFWRPIGGEIYHAQTWLRLALTLVQLAGVWITARAVGAIDPFELAGIRTSSHAEGLQVTGAYHLVRHPIYLGWMLLVFAAPHMTGDRLAFAVISSVYLIIAVPWEEQSLEQAFGDAYRRYKEHVRWRVVPYIY